MVTTPAPPPSFISMVPLSSSSVMRLPLFDLMTRFLLEPSALASGALSLPFHSAPTMIGRPMSPCSNITSTSSSTSGSENQPRSLPAPIDTQAHHHVLSVMGMVGNLTLMRQSFWSSLM